MELVRRGGPSAFSLTMATVGDWLGLLLIGTLAYAIFMGVRRSADAKKLLEEKRAELKAHGFNISSEGISIKSDHVPLDRSKYIESTSRKFGEGGQFLSEHANSIKFGSQQSSAPREPAV
ncbi:hypothetical protein MSPP1_000936 [Malassezia sp. CBS 17886]|nr:hypothetical protein MSPP1_000936 [Malassezia sp. CBS 17886]